MAVSYSDIAAALNTIMDDAMISQINRAGVLLQVLPVAPVKGKAVNWDARFGTAVGSAITDGGTVSTFNADTKVPASLEIATYHDAFGMTGRAMSGAMNAGGPDDLVNLFEESVMESSERLASGINAALYTGTGSTSPETIAGLTGAALLTTGSYAGLSRVTYTQWQSNVLANGGVGRDLTITLMRDMKRAIYTASGVYPDLVICDPNQHERYGNLLSPQRRYTQEVTLRGQKIVLDGGYQALEFDGVPVFADKDCPAGKMIFLSSRHVGIKVLPDATQQLVGGTNGETDIAGSEEAQQGLAAAKVRGRIQPLAVNGDVRNFAVFSYLQLQVRRPNACGVLSDLNS